MIRPKQPLQSFTFSNRPDHGRTDIVFVVKDGTIGAGTLSDAPKVVSGSRGGVALVAGGLKLVEPGLEGDRTPDEDRDDETDDEEGTVTRVHRFQLHPSRVSTILAEASTSRAASPAPSSLLKGIQPSHTHDQAEVRSRGTLDEAFNWDVWQRSLRNDIGWIMQRRASEGYGLADVNRTPQGHTLSADLCLSCN